jgi:hypothetical protein
VTDRWPQDLVAERWEAFTADEREALMRFGHRQAPWEAVPDTARRLLLTDPKVSLEGVRTIDAIFRAAYAEMVTL